MNILILKRKINHTFFFGNRGYQKGGRGGYDIWEKFPKNPVFFLGGVPKAAVIQKLKENMNDSVDSPPFR